MNEESHLVPEKGHRRLDRGQLTFAFCPQEDTEYPYRLQTGLLRDPATLTLVDQDATTPAFLSESDRLGFSTAEVLLQGPYTAAVANGLDRDPPFPDRLVDRCHPGVIPDRLQLLPYGIGNEDLVERSAEKMKLVDGGEVEEW